MLQTMLMECKSCGRRAEQVFEVEAVDDAPEVGGWSTKNKPSHRQCAECMVREGKKVDADILTAIRREKTDNIQWHGPTLELTPEKRAHWTELVRQVENNITERREGKAA